MANLPNIRKSLESGQIYIPLWINGLHCNRSPLMTPMSAMGIQIVSRYDTLWGGSNMELTMQNTVARRPGFPQWCNQAFGSGEFPLSFYSYKNLSGSITTLVDTQTNIYSFTPTAKTSIFSKTGGAVETSFQRVGNCLYMANGVNYEATADNGTISTARPVGLAVPTVSPTFTIAANGFLLPTSGWTYGFSYGNSTSGQVSTMSPISSDVGDLDVQSVTESSITVQVTTANTAGSSGGSAGTVTFGTPNGNNFWVGAKVTLSGFGQAQMNQTYTITVVSGVSFGASTAVWGPASGGFGQNANVQISNLTGVKAVMNPITIPGAAAASPYVYTVVQASIFAPTNAWDAVTPSPMGVTGPKGSPVYVQIQSGTPTTGHFVVNASTGAITFAAADAGKTIILGYAITPVTGGTPVSFAVTGPSANNAFSAGTQTDTTGYAGADSIIVYRDQDTDGVNGPWFFLAQIPNDITLTAATYTSQTNQTTYTFSNAVPAGVGNGFAGATGTGGATIAGFTNSGNNGTFDIVASTTTSITCTNPNGVTETHAGTVNSGVWKYTDTGAVYGYAFDTTVPDGELDLLVEAPIDDENNPPPNTTNPLTTSVTGTFSLICYNAGRIFGAVDNYVYFAGGPDVTFGNGNESFPPANVFTFPGKVTALASVPAGLVVFTSDQMWIIYGTSTGTFYPQLYQNNLGVASQNSVVLDGQTLYIYSNQSQLWSFTDSLNEIGLNVAPLLMATFTPATVYLTMHRMGEDVGLFISDGSTNYLRYRIDQGSWSPLCQIVNGASCLQSIETSTGVYTLLAGSASGSGHISGRNLTTYTDLGGTYTCSAIVGSLIVAAPGSTALVEYLTMQYMPVGSAPTISILSNQIATLSGTGPWFTLGAGVMDPPHMIQIANPTLIQNRFYLKSCSSPIPQEMNNCMVEFVFPSENFKAEVLSLGVQ